MFHAEKCTLCGDCLSACPHLDYSPQEAREEFARLMRREPSPVTARCITCAACNTICPEGANPFDLINELQEETGTFRPKDKAVAAMDFAGQLPSEVIRRHDGRTAMDLCILGDLIPGVVEGQLFDGLNLIKGGDYFCHIGWIHLGRPGHINRKNAQRCVDNLARTGFDEIICYHDDCYALFANKLDDLGIQPPFKVTHLFEYLRDYVAANAASVRKLDLPVAYQQPCASRYTLDKEPLLDELFELIGVRRVDRRYDRNDALCCTGGMGASQNYTREEVYAWRDRNVLDACEAGAEAMAFLCPMCAMSLRHTALTNGLKPFMISNLVRLALGEDLPQGGAGEGQAA